MLAAGLVLAAAALAGCGSGPRDSTDSTDTAAGASVAGDPAEGAALAAAVFVRATGCRQAEASTGSGSLVGDGGLVVTVAHVVAGSTSVTVAEGDGTEHRASVVALDPVNDLALLAVDGLAATPLPLGSLAAGDRAVFVVHDADGRATAEPATVVRRVDLSMADLYGQGTHVRPGFELDATVDPGDSGAVLVAADGRAGAVVFATSRDGATTGPTPSSGGGGGSGRRAWATDVAALGPLLAGPVDTPVPTGWSRHAGF